MTGSPITAPDLRSDHAFFELLTGSYARLVGQQLVPAGADARWLYEAAPFVVVAHNGAADPCFVYANRAAQACFEYPWEVFTTLPSRLSAEAPDRAERQVLLDTVARHGYRGLRVKQSGRRFWMEDGLVWQLLGRDGVLHGQAATFSTWHDA